MKILFWQWNAFMQKGMEKALSQLHIVYDVFELIPADWERDDAFCAALAKQMEKSYDCVLSVNFCPLVSNICEQKGISYLAWVYDSPVHIRNLSSFRNSCNRIFFFDRGQAKVYQKMGYERIYHLPLAAYAGVFESASGQTGEQYQCDVAMVGQLYQSDYDYLMGPLPLYERGVMEGIINMQGQLYGAYILDEMLNDKRMEELNQYYRKASGGTFSVRKEELEYACACEVTGRERKMALALLAPRFNVHLHCGTDSYEKSGAASLGVKNHGYVDYYSQMPLVFANAKINLNMSLKTIRTGIPLRVLDVMSCGGFLLSNYQEELYEYFEPGVDLVVYHDVKEIVQLVQYYLTHEEERRQIARNGQRKIKELFGFEDRIQAMLGTLQ